MESELRFVSGLENRPEPMGAETVRDTKKNKIKKFDIEQLDRGYVVNVGCHTFAFSTKEELLAKLTEYINEPARTERKWFDDNLF